MLSVNTCIPTSLSYFSVAEDRFLESLQLAENLPPEDSYTYFLAVLKNLGSFYMQFKKFDLTAPLYEKAFEIATKVSVSGQSCTILYSRSQPVHDLSKIVSWLV